jgi:hypothetical protein
VFWRRRIFWLFESGLAFAALALVAGLWPADCIGAPTVVITNLPAYGTTNDLSGVALGANPATQKLAVFIYVPGYGWVTKPTCAQPLSVIQSTGNWVADITTGGSDTNATRVAALLVNTNYSQPCVQGTNFIPTNIFSQTLASAVVTRQYPGVRWLSFSGYDWWVKTSPGKVGPGPNYFSDSTNNVWLDGQNQLHLRITNRSNQWQCAEVVTARTFGAGGYRFAPASRVDNLNPNVVLGLFTWSDDPVFADREIDIECSRWGNAADVNNAQYVVQPYDQSGHLVRFAVPNGQTNSTLLFIWETSEVDFQSQRGSYVANPSPANVISNWTYTLTVPETGDENVRMNLWLYNGAAPTDSNEVEVVIQSFQFVPLGTPQPATLTNMNRLPGGQTHFVVNNAQPDRRYEVQGSTNLFDWQNLAVILATNGAVDFSETNSVGRGSRFYRTVTLP